MNNTIDRRNFMKSAALGTGLLIAGCEPYSPKTTASLPLLSSVQSPNEEVVLAVAGIRSRGRELIKKFLKVKNCRVKYVIDVDTRYLAEAVQTAQKQQTASPEAITDFRRALDDSDVDAMVIATPDHWHAPMAIEALKAGKHVYVEKPCSHNPWEGEMLVKAARKYNRLVQMGNQRRSMGFVENMCDDLANGLIGRLYLAKCFYVRKRDPIGFGKEIAVPDYLDWNLWQGPAPRTAYRDNIHPYNWHWFYRWGTGEALNNGVHMLDIARWAFRAQFPGKVSSRGGRWHYQGQDDWQWMDTQEIMLEYPDDRMITWFGRSVNTFGENYKNFGVLFFGAGGTLDYDGNADYKLYDIDNKLLRDTRTERQEEKKTVRGTTTDPGLQDRHTENFIGAIRGQEKLSSPIDEGHISTTLGHLGNISWRVGQTLDICPQTGHILKNKAAQKLWKRNYAPGWEPKI